MKKRVLSLCLALVMCVGLAVPAFAAAVSTKAGVNLTPAEQKIYKVLENAVMEVAEGKRTDTRVTVEFEPGELSWTAEELGVSSIDEEHAYAPADEKAGELVSNAWYCLKLNYPPLSGSGRAPSATGSFGRSIPKTASRPQVSTVLFP